ncbi:hypothetical protein ACQ4PT_014507 [Festuca glaucescens]
MFGDRAGDSGGDLATPSPARDRKVSNADGSPEWLRGSRFWLLDSSDDEEEGAEEGLSPGSEDFDTPVKYLCHTPSPVHDRDIAEDSKELVRRALKRIKRRDAQRMATKAAMAFASLEVEEPMYTLPEVWVRVSGLPSDIRSDYLSLWGVGSLFGKTLDVDMAYTRSNKLHFEVEEANGSQEVDMAEVNNGNDGNDDAHNGEHNKEGGNAMDMDPKGLDEGATSNNDGQGGSINNNGIQGMQLHAHHLDEIKIGSINVQLSPTGNLPRDCPRWVSGRWDCRSNSVCRLSQQLNGSCSGGSTRVDEFDGATCAAMLQGEQLANSSQQTGVCAAATCVGAQQGPQLGGSSQQASVCAAATCVGVRLGLQHADSHHGNSQQDSGSSVATSTRSVQRGPQAGLAVAAKAVVAMFADRVPAQKIHAHGEGPSGPEPLPAMHAAVNDKVMMTRDQPMIGTLGIDAMGSSAAQQEMGNGGAMHLGRSLSLDNLVKGARNDHILSKMEEDGSYGLQNSMGMASSMKNKE